MTRSPHGRICIVQPVIPSYRRDFFKRLALTFGNRFRVYSSDVDMGTLTSGFWREPWERPLGPLREILPGVEWQVGAFSVPVARGDIIVVSGAPRCLSNLALLLRARLRGARTVWWGQYWSASSRWHRFVLRIILMRLAHAVLLYTDAEIVAYRAGWGRHDKRLIRALNNGIDMEPIRLLRRIYLPSERSANLLFIGRLTRKTGLGILLLSLADPLLAHATLHVIGEGPERVSLQCEAERRNLAGRVIWHGETIDESRIAMIANQSALFCYPGGVGLSLIHAMAYGLPSVVHDDKSTHMPEIAAFEDGHTGAFFRKGDSTDLARIIAKLLDDTDRRRTMSRNALNLALGQYNTATMAMRFVEMVGAL